MSKLLICDGELLDRRARLDLRSNCAIEIQQVSGRVVETAGLHTHDAGYGLMRIGLLLTGALPCKHHKD